MTTRRNITLFLLYHLIFFLPAYSQVPARVDESAVVFSIRGKPVTAAEFKYLYRKNHQPGKDEFTRSKIEEYLELFINFKLKVTEAQLRGLDTTAAFQKEFNTYRDELRKPYLPDAKIIDSLVRLTYERMKEEINASHILIAVEPDASPGQERAALERITEIRKRAVNGEDFGTLAAEVSADPTAKVNKGNLGYFTALQMVYPFELAAYQTPEGSISNPVRTRFGYHILRVNDRRPASGEVEVSHMLIRTGENKDNAAAKNTVFEIYDQLKSGVSWDELCKQYSEDPATRETGGKLRPFGVGAMASVPEFEKIAFELQKPGEFSDPFETQFGWHIVKLERKIPFPAFEEIASTLKNRVARDERVQVSRQSMYDQLKTAHQYRENPAVKSKILSLADTALQSGSWRNPQIPNVGKEVIFTLDGKPFHAASFLEYVARSQKPNTLAPARYMEQMLNSFVELKLAELVEAQVMETSPDYKWLLNEYYEGILLFEIMEKEVWNKASADSAGQRKFYENNRKSYHAGERVRADIYSSGLRDNLEKLKSLLEKPDTLKVAEAIASLKIRNDSGIFSREDRIVLSKIPWATGMHLVENNNLHYLVNVKEIVGPGRKTFEEARPEVISDYQAFLEKEWIEALKRKYPVKINKKGKEAVFRELSDAKSK